MVNFILPGFYENYNLNTQFIKLWKDRPEVFYDGVNISSVYGNFQFCIFDGGRVFNDYTQATKEQIETVIAKYNYQYNIPLRLICTNTELTEHDFYNRFGNLCLNLCENDMNEITINRSDFESFIREHYPKYKFVSSTTKCLTKTNDFLNEINNPKYFMVCLDYNLNHNWKMLDEIPEELRPKCEFLVNAICPSGCPTRKEHYKLNSLFSLTYGKPYNVNQCMIKYSTTNPLTWNYPNNISPEEIYNKYVPKGYCYFKIEGRSLSTTEVLGNYLRYMIKPEYHFEIFQALSEDDTPTKMKCQRIIYD